jgi:hypothetical protein
MSNVIFARFERWSPISLQSPNALNRFWAKILPLGPHYRDSVKLRIYILEQTHPESHLQTTTVQMVILSANFQANRGRRRAQRMEERHGQQKCLP